MTTPSPVQAVPGFTIADESVPSIPVYRIYTLVTDLPERIEAVHMTLTYEADPAEVTNDLFVLQLCDLSGVVVDEVASGTIVGQVHIPMVVSLNWARQGTDVPVLGVYAYQTVGEASLWMWTNARLPELVLQPGSFVNLLAYRDRSAESPAIQVSDATVTTTRNPGPGSTTSAAQGIPLLTPTDNS